MALKLPTKIEIIEVEDGSRFYCKGKKIKYPSVTTVLDKTLPPDDHLKNYFRQYGWVGQQVFKKAGEEGTRIHRACEDLEAGIGLSSGQFDEKEKKCIQSFLDFYGDYSPKLIESEKVVMNSKYKYGGRLDRIYKINEALYLVDLKTGQKKRQDKIQVAAYWYALKLKYPELVCGILYLGSTAKTGYTLDTFEPAEYLKHFVLLRKLYDVLHPDPLAKKRDYPDTFQL